MFLGSPKVFIAGHCGLVGSALVRFCRRERPNYQLLLRSHFDLDLLDQARVFVFFQEEKPDFVILAAAKVGGD